MIIILRTEVLLQNIWTWAITFCKIEIKPKKSIFLRWNKIPSSEGNWTLCFFYTKQWNTKCLFIVYFCSVKMCVFPSLMLLQFHCWYCIRVNRKKCERSWTEWIQLTSRKLNGFEWKKIAFWWIMSDFWWDGRVITRKYHHKWQFFEWIAAFQSKAVSFYQFFCELYGI